MTSWYERLVLPRLSDITCGLELAAEQRPSIAPQGSRRCSNSALDPVSISRSTTHHELLSTRLAARYDRLPVKPSLAVATLLLASCSPSGGPPELHLTDAWARETVSGQTATAAYLRIANGGGSGDRLVAVTAPVPARASLHASWREDQIARMRPIEGGLEMPPGETVTLEPGGAHVMIENLAEPLHPGETLRLNLRFTRSGERTIEVSVQSAGASGPAHQGR